MCNLYDGYQMSFELCILDYRNRRADPAGNSVQCVHFIAIDGVNFAFSDTFGIQK